MEEVVMDLESAETSGAPSRLGVAAAWDTVTAALVRRRRGVTCVE